MATFTINHVLSRLLRESAILSSRNQSLYETTLQLRSDVEARLRELGMELVIIEESGIAHARNMTDEQLDALSEHLKCEPISSVCSHNRLTYYDSVAVVYFRMSLDQELRQGGDAIWLTRNEVFEQLGKHYSESVAEDRIALEDRINKCIGRLVDLKLLTLRAMGNSSTYRGTALMQAAFSRDAMATFAQDMNMIADTEGSTEATRREACLVDFDDLEPQDA
ncbi:DUF4194 domain-containing protein [Loktanella sp. DJP18]|uniref:DUF4194 domain-containing protein n=1 Tax=Loktanella sp. DJP18 TaxID=3409788 RepID=UPI003BB7F051